MNTIVASLVGSGTSPYVAGILPAEQRGNEPTGQGVRTGTQVMIGNPEDMVAVDAFACSGAIVTTAATQIIHPDSHPLPRARQVIIQNLGAAGVFIGHTDNLDVLINQGYFLEAIAATFMDATVTLPLMAGVPVWAVTSTGTANIRMLIL